MKSRVVLLERTLQQSLYALQKKGLPHVPCRISSAAFSSGLSTTNKNGTKNNPNHKMVKTPKIISPAGNRVVTITGRRDEFSSMPAMDFDTWDDDDDDDDDDDRETCKKQGSTKHYDTCTCEESHRDSANSTSTPSTSESARPRTVFSKYACGTPQHEDEYKPLPPPLPEPSYSVHKRVLPSSLTALSSPNGRRYLLESFTNQTAESYFSLTEQFVNQSDPAFCGITTLLMILNAMCIDPQVRWRGGWRFYGSEDVLLGRCCLSSERIRRVGVTLEEFRNLGRCQGLEIDLKRPHDENKDDQTQHNYRGDKNDERFSIDEFRQDIRKILATPGSHSILAVSFSRASLGQTGDGHFSPLAAYHEETDQVLLLDVARFKYSPYWVTVEDLYDSMVVKDSVTNKPRGWFLLHPPKKHRCYHHLHEDRRPAELVPQAGEKDVCPVGKVKVEFCQANPSRS